MKLNRFFYAGRQLSIAIAILGVLFRLQHWVSANTLLLIGACGVMVFQMGWFAVKKPKQLLDYARTLALITYVLSGVFRLMHWPYGDILRLIFYPIGVFWIVLEAARYMGFTGEQSTRSRRDLLVSMLAGFAAVLVIAGALFKLQHWPYGNAMLITGLASAVIWLALESALFGNGNAYLKRLTPLVWLAFLLIVTGICFKFLAMPYSNGLILGGIGVIVISLGKDIFKY